MFIDKAVMAGDIMRHRRLPETRMELIPMRMDQTLQPRQILESAPAK
jgi:hypothetical protein